MHRVVLMLVVVGFALLAPVGPAAAATVDSVGDSFTIDFGGNIEGSDVPGLEASAFFEVESISADTLVLSITLTNTSNALWDSARISALGFDTDPSIESASLSSTVFGNVNLGGQFPNGFGGVDVCIVNNRNNCTGGGGGGLTIGQSTEMLLTLNLSGAVASVELDNFGVRYQSLSSKKLGFSGASGTGTPGTPSNPIPEPSSVAMFLLGAAILVVFARKQVLTRS